MLLKSVVENPDNQYPITGLHGAAPAWVSSPPEEGLTTIPQKGFEIFGITFDTTASWLNAVKENEMGWVHVGPAERTST